MVAPRVRSSSATNNKSFPAPRLRGGEAALYPLLPDGAAPTFGEVELRPVLVTNRKQYWSLREVVLVGRVTSTGWFLLLLRGCLTAPFFEDEVEGVNSCGGRWLGGLLERGALLIIVEAYE